jgi:hypothetical protein
MTNTMMFSFLSAFVSYDNLTNLLAAMSVYYLFAFFKHRSGSHLVASLLCQSAGCLTKTTFLPLALILGILLAVHEVRNIACIPSALRRHFLASGMRGGLLALGLFFAIILNGLLFGGNYLKYGNLEPAMEQVLPLENAMHYRLTARNYIIHQFRDGKISINQAWDMASRITHTKDRLDTIGLVNNYAQLSQAGFKPMGLLEYSGAWAQNMMATIFGIKAHISMPNQGISLLALELLALLAGTAFVVRCRLRDDQCLPTMIMAVAFFYPAFLMFKINYPAYLDSWNIGLTVSGRYIFPVIGPIYVLSSLYLMRLFTGRYLRLALAAVAAIILIGSDFPYFMIHVAPDWYPLS